MIHYLVINSVCCIGRRSNKRPVYPGKINSGIKHTVRKSIVLVVAENKFYLGVIGVLHAGNAVITELIPDGAQVVGSGIKYKVIG